MCSDQGLLEYWEEAHREVTQKQGEHVDPWAGRSHLLSPGDPSSPGIRMTTYLVIQVSLPSLGQSWKVVGVALEKADSSSR